MVRPFPRQPLLRITLHRRILPPMSHQPRLNTRNLTTTTNRCPSQCPSRRPHRRTRAQPRNKRRSGARMEAERAHMRSPIRVQAHLVRVRVRVEIVWSYTRMEDGWILTERKTRSPEMRRSHPRTSRFAKRILKCNPTRARATSEGRIQKGFGMLYSLDLSVCDTF